MNIKVIKRIAGVAVATMAVAGLMFCGGGTKDASDKTATAETAQETIATADTSGEFAEIIPSGYRLVREEIGDLNKDGLEDRVLLVARSGKGYEDYHGNGVVILFNEAGAQMVDRFENLELFGDNCRGDASCNVMIERGNLIFAYNPGRGTKKWTFRYRDNNFELIGEDEIHTGAEVSVNYLTKRRLTVTVNINGGRNEAWEDIMVDRLILLQDVKELVNITGYQTQTAPNVETGTVTDRRDGKTYRTVTIGNLTWMAENLNFGDVGKCYNDNAENCEKYGRLYNREEAMNVCPDGWRLPTENEWRNLVDLAGNSERLLAKNSFDNCDKGTDDFGFAVLSCVDNDESVGSNSWFIFDEYSVHIMFGGVEFYFPEDISEDDFLRAFWYSVRCVKD